MTQFSFEWILSLNRLSQKWGQVHILASTRFPRNTSVSIYTRGEVTHHERISYDLNPSTGRVATRLGTEGASHNYDAHPIG